MTDFHKLLSFFEDLESLEKMQPRYPLGTPIGDALAATIAEFSSKAKTLNAFFDREPLAPPQPRRRAAKGTP